MQRRVSNPGETGRSPRAEHHRDVAYLAGSMHVCEPGRFAVELAKMWQRRCIA
jgi:hypothetical protein